MFNKFAVMTIITVILSLFPCAAWARYHPGIKWRTVRNEHFTVYYPEGHEAFARRVLSLGDEVYGDVTGYLGVKPRRTPIVLNPDTDVFNGFFTPFPNHISLFETPESNLKGFGSSLDDLVDLIYTHEYAHFAHITTRRGLYGMLTRVIGDGFAITNINSPGWALEGITTNLETRFTTGGRGRSPLFRSQVLDFARRGDLWSMSASGTESPHSPPQNRIYHSGLYMVEYLNRTYGDDAFARLSRYQAAHPFRGAGRALKHVTGKSHRAFYREYSTHVTSIADSLRRVAESKGLPAGRVILPVDLDGYLGHYWTERGTIMALRRGYSRKTALIEADPQTGEITGETPTGIMYHHTPVRKMPDGRLFFGGNFYHPLGDGAIDVSDLVVFNPDSKKYERLTNGAHIYSADISPDGRTFAAVRRNGMWVDLVLIDCDGSNLRTLVSRPGLYWQSPRWSPDGETIAVTVKAGSYTDIALVNPCNGDIRLLFASDVHGDGDPSFSPDGRWLVFSSSRDGVWNVHAWDLADERLYQLTSVFTAALEPLVSPDGRTLSFLVRSKILNEVRTMPFEPQKGCKIAVGRVGKLPEPDLGRLEPVGSLQSRNVPLWEAYKPFIHTPFPGKDEKGFSAGLLFAGCDPVYKNMYAAQFLYGLESNRAAYDVILMNSSFWPMIDLRAYDTAQENNTPGGDEDFWLRERGGELSMNLNMMHRVVPTLLYSNMVVGTRFRKFSSLEDTVTIESDHDFSSSFYGEFRVIRISDYAPRDMAMGWRQYLYVSLEKGSGFLKGELPGYNQLFVVRQSIPSPFRYHGLELSLFHQQQSGRLRYDNGIFIPRGYDDADEAGGFNLKKNLSFTLEYRFPILFMDRGLGVNFIHFNCINGSFYIDHGAGWQGSFDSGEWGRRARTSIGATLTTGFNLFSFIPIEFGVGAGYKTREEKGFTYMVLMTPLGDISELNRFGKYRYFRPLQNLMKRNIVSSGLCR